MLESIIAPLSLLKRKEKPPNPNNINFRTYSAMNSLRERETYLGFEFDYSLGEKSPNSKGGKKVHFLLPNRPNEPIALSRIKNLIRLTDLVNLLISKGININISPFRSVQFTEDSSNLFFLTNTLNIIPTPDHKSGDLNILWHLLNGTLTWETHTSSGYRSLEEVMRDYLSFKKKIGKDFRDILNKPVDLQVLARLMTLANSNGITISEDYKDS